MTFPACPDAFSAVFPTGCDDANAGAPPLLPAHPLTWHLVPLSPSATALVLVLLSILFTTLLVSKPQK